MIGDQSGKERAFKSFSDVSGQDNQVFYPSSSKISPPDNVDFVYVMRKDVDFLSNTLSRVYSDTYGLDTDVVSGFVSDQYEKFIDRLSSILLKNFNNKGVTRIDVINDDDVVPKQLKKCRDVLEDSGEDTVFISMDPLIRGDKIAPLTVSRHYFPGGRNELRLDARPGTEDLKSQIENIKELARGKKVGIIEDDIFSGGTLARMVRNLQKEGVVVSYIIPGIQVGNPEKITGLGVDTDPIFQYFLKDHQDMDLGDPRDFLFGFDGLVTNFGHDEVGRLPYIMPFVSTHARMSLPKDQDRTFSSEILALSRKFYERMEEEFGGQVLLKHCSEHFRTALGKYMDVDADTPVLDVINGVENGYDALLRRGAQLELDSKITAMELPDKMVFLDINGTILPDDSDGSIPSAELAAFKASVANLSARGVTVGLNSDSPLDKMQEFAERLGIADAPIIAENGAVLSYAGKQVSLMSIDELSDIKAKISQCAEEMGLIQGIDAVAPEFGGQELSADNLWAFGAGRNNSISVFGPAKFIEKIGQIVPCEGVSCDVSPQHNFFAVHEGANYRLNKSIALEAIQGAGKFVTMIGDSRSDYAELAFPNQVVMVKPDALSQEYLERDHVVVTQNTGFQGVVEHLNNMVASMPCDQDCRSTRKFQK